MKITVSDASFHKSILSRYGIGKMSMSGFPSLFFLRKARDHISRIIDMHVRLNFHIQKIYFGMSSGLLEKSHEIFKIIVNGMTSIFNMPVSSIENHDSKKIFLIKTINQKGILDALKSVGPDSLRINHIFSSKTMNGHGVNYPITSNNEIFQRDLHQTLNYFKSTNKDIFASTGAINNIFSNYIQSRSNVIPLRIVNKNNIVSLRISNYGIIYHPLVQANGNNFTQTAYYWKTYDRQTINNALTPAILNVRTFNNQNAFGDIFVPGRTFNNQNAFSSIFVPGRTFNNLISNFSQIDNNIFPHETFNENKNFFLKENIEMHPQVFRSNAKTMILSSHIMNAYGRNVLSHAGNIYYDFSMRSMPEVNNVFKGNISAGVDIVFNKTYHENITSGKKKPHEEKIISTKIREDDLNKKFMPQILQGEINSIANKVYRLIEKKLSIEKEKRGFHIIG